MSRSQSPPPARFPASSWEAAMRAPEHERTHACVGGPARRLVGNRLAVLVHKKSNVFSVIKPLVNWIEHGNNGSPQKPHPGY